MAKWAVPRSELPISGLSELHHRATSQTGRNRPRRHIVDPSCLQSLFPPRVGSRNPTGISNRRSLGTIFPYRVQGIKQRCRIRIPDRWAQLAKEVGAKRIQAFCNSQLVTNKFNGDYDIKNERMEAYLGIVQCLAKDFEAVKIIKIPRSDNTAADALVALASTLDSELRRIISVEAIASPSIELPCGVCHITELNDEE